MAKEVEKLKAEIERLKKELKSKKKYGLVWEPKEEEVVEMCKEKLPVLKEVKNKAIITDKDKPVNLLIEGDNYHALSVLNYTHAKKVDVIYIDPPYNTGNKDFIFNDRYVDREDAYRHSKWLAFMEKRLKLAKNLLKDSGVIFISIDDNEVAQLKMLMDDKNKGFFGEENFIGLISVKSTPGGRQSSSSIASMGDYLLVYSRTTLGFKSMKGLPLTEKYLETYNKKDKIGRYLTERLRQHGVAERREDVPSLFFPIYYNEKSNKVSIYKIKGYSIEILPKLPSGGDGRWIWSKDKVERDKDLIEVRKVKRNGSYTYDAFFKKYLKDELRSKIPSIWLDNEFRTEIGTKELKDIFGGEKLFSYPKPTSFIKSIIQSCLLPEGLVLDFFAGTGTTAHAVFALNKKDGGNRQFILCTNNENNICAEVCYPRIKKVIEGYKNLKGEEIESLGGNLKYFKTDFVDAEPTDKSKIKLTQQATEMLCIKEGTFESVVDNKKFKIFKNSNHYTGIIWDQMAIPEFKQKIKGIKGQFSVYIFSFSDETFDEEFADIKQKAKLSPVPEAILRVYRRIFK